MPPSGSAAASVMSKPASRFSAMVPGDGPPISQPVRLPPLSVSRSEKATSVPLRRPCADHGHRLDAAIGVHALRACRQGHRAARRTEFVGGEGIARDPMLALEGDIGRALLGVAVDQGHAFGVAVLVIEQRLPVSSEQRTEHDIAQALERAAVIVEIGPEPGPGVGDGEQAGAGRIERERRVAAEIARLGEQVEPAPEDQLAELLALGVLAVEVDRDGGDGGRDRLVESNQRLVGECRDRDCREKTGGDKQAPSFVSEPPHAN